VAKPFGQVSRKGTWKTNGKCQIALFASSDTSTDIERNYDSDESQKSGNYHHDFTDEDFVWPDVVPDVIFSSDGCYLACLVPRPVCIHKILDTMDGKIERNEEKSSKETTSIESKSASNVSAKFPGVSTVVIFTLEKYLNRDENLFPNVKLPNYISIQSNNSGSNDKKTVSDVELPTPYNPRIISPGTTKTAAEDLTSDSTALLKHITCLCDIPIPQGLTSFESFKSILFAGCSDGEIISIGYKRARLASIIQKEKIRRSKSIDYCFDNCQAVFDRGMRHMAYKQCSTKRSKGRLVSVRRDGSVSIFSISFFNLTKLQNGNNSSRNFDDSLLHLNGISIEENLKEKENTAVSPIVYYCGSDIVIEIKSQNCHFGQKKLNTSLNFIPSFYKSALIDDDLLAFVTNPLLRCSHELEVGQEKEFENSKIRNIVAQVWLLGEEEFNVRTSLIAELIMDDQKLSELQNDSYFFQEKNHNRITRVMKGEKSNMNNTDNFTYQNHSNLLFMPSLLNVSICCDPRTKCLALSSILVINSPLSKESLMMKAFNTIWDWKNNISGFTLVGMVDIDKKESFDKRDKRHTKNQIRRFNRNLSFLYFSLDEMNGKCLVHLYGISSFPIRKYIYETSVLSPSELDDNSLSKYRIEEPSPLLISPKSVSFPYLSAPKNKQDSTIHWAESYVPTDYLSQNGPIRISSIGKKFGRSIAVAGHNGLCILDLSMHIEGEKIGKEGDFSTPCTSGFDCDDNSWSGIKSLYPKWRMFGIQEEEQSFTVKSMTWWERGLNTGVSEDILIAVIEYSGENTVRNNSLVQSEAQNYLVAWSRRRLGMGPLQLMEPSEFDDKDKKKDRLGIRLPAAKYLDHLSILAEPDSQSLYQIEERRNAIVLVSSQVEDHKGDTSYVAYNLQVKSKSPSPSNNFHDDHVLGILLSMGQINYPQLCQMTKQPMGKVNNIFIASVAFDSDISKACEDDQRMLSCILTLCVLGNNGSILLAVAVGPNGPVSCGLIYSGRRSKNLIRSFWISDVMQSNEVIQESTLRNYITWNFFTFYGDFIVWSMPFNFSHDYKPSVASRLDHYALTNQYDSSCDEEIRCIEALMMIELEASHSTNNWNEVRNRGLLGQVCSINKCFKGYSCYDNEMNIGIFPSMNCRCILYAGQQSRNLGCFPNDGQSKLYGVSDCKIGPPAFISSLFLAISHIARQLRENINSRQIDKKISQDQINNFYQEYSTLRMRGNESFDLLLPSLSMIVIFLVERLYSNVPKQQSNYNTHSIHQIQQSTLFFKIFLHKIVELIKESTNPIKYASFFLSIGRQLEQHYFDILFQFLSTSTNERISKGHFYHCKINPSDINSNIITVQDFFDTSLSFGSISIAASSLPLFTKYISTKIKCNGLFHHCITNLFKTFANTNTLNYSQILTDYASLQQLYHYGMKFDDVAKFEEEINDCAPNDDTCLEVEKILDDRVNARKSKEKINVDDSKKSQCKNLESFDLLSYLNLSLSRRRKDDHSMCDSGKLDQTHDFDNTTELEVRSRSKISSFGANNIVVWSVSDIAAKAILTSLMSLEQIEKNENHHITFLMKLSALSFILKVNTESHKSFTESGFNRLELHSLSQNDFDPVLKISIYDDLVGVLRTMTKFYSNHLDSQTSNDIYEFLCFTISQLNKSHWPRSLVGPIVFVLIASGHACGRIQDMLDKDGRISLLGDIYKECCKGKFF